MLETSSKRPQCESHVQPQQKVAYPPNPNTQKRCNTEKTQNIACKHQNNRPPAKHRQPHLRTENNAVKRLQSRVEETNRARSTVLPVSSHRQNAAVGTPCSASIDDFRVSDDRHRVRTAREHRQETVIGIDRESAPRTGSDWVSVPMQADDLVRGCGVKPSNHDFIDADDTAMILRVQLDQLTSGIGDNNVLVIRRPRSSQQLRLVVPHPRSSSKSGHSEVIRPKPLAVDRSDQHIAICVGDQGSAAVS